MYTYTHIFMAAVYVMAVMGAVVFAVWALRMMNFVWKHVFIKMADYREQVRAHDSLVAAVWREYEKK